MSKQIATASTQSKVKSFRSQFIKKVAGSLGLKIAYTGLSFIISIVLARILAAEGFGIFAYVTAWVNLLRFPATLGLDQVITREVAIYETQSNWGHMRGLLTWSNKIVLLASTAIALVAIGTSWVLAGSDFTLRIALCIALAALPIHALRKLRVSAMKGLHQVTKSLAPELLIAPLLLLIFIGLSFLKLGESFNVFWVLGIKTVVVSITFVIGAHWLYQTLPPEVNQAVSEYKISNWLRSAFPLIFLEGMHLVNSRLDIFMLGAINGMESVGIYAAINRGVQLSVFILAAVNVVLAPTIASLYTEGKIKKLQKIVTKTSRVVFLISCLISSIIVVCSHWYLTAFGNEFIQGKNALIILSIGQLFNSAAGSVKYLLTMTGHENQVALSVGISAILNTILNALLIPQWGMNGAAIATASSLISVNILNIIWVYKKIGINSTALGKLF